MQERVSNLFAAAKAKRERLPSPTEIDARLQNVLGAVSGIVNDACGKLNAGEGSGSAEAGAGVSFTGDANFVSQWTSKADSATQTLLGGLFGGASGSSSSGASTTPTTSNCSPACAEGETCRRGFTGE